MRARMGLAQTGGQQIELIQPDSDVPSIYTEFLAAGGTGVHHLCYWGDLDRCITHFGAQGAELVQDGTTGNGNRFVYLSDSCGLPYPECRRSEKESSQRALSLSDVCTRPKGCGVRSTNIPMAR